METRCSSERLEEQKEALEFAKVELQDCNANF